MKLCAALLALAQVCYGCNYPRSGYLYNVIVDDGISNTKQYLSVNSAGSKADLYYFDDGSGRQQWHLEDRGGFWWLLIDKGVYSGKDHLSVNGDGSWVDLWYFDDVSGRQRWLISDAAGNDDAYCNIKIYGGVSGTKRFLTAKSDGSLVDLWHSDDGSGRHRWRFQEIGKAAAVPAEKYQPRWGLEDRFTFKFASWWTPVLALLLAVVLIANVMVACGCFAGKSQYRTVKAFDTDVECN